MAVKPLPVAAAAQLLSGRRCIASALPLAAPSRRGAGRAGVLAGGRGLSLRAPARLRLSSVTLRASAAGADDSSGPVERRMSTVYAYAGELFSDNYQFLIPVYQRVYEWEKEEVEVLLNDLESRLDTQQDVSKLEAYPMGMLTLKRHTSMVGDKKHDVVDGQQRLTTLSLVLAAVKHHLARGDAPRQEKVHQTYEKFLLQPECTARSLFMRAVQEREPQDWAAVAAGLHDKEKVARRMAENLSVIATFLDDWKDDAKVEQLAKYIIRRCEFAVSVTTDQQLAVQVFRSQTGRGRDLQPSDILKANLIDAIDQAHPLAEGEKGPSRADEFGDWWQELETDITRERLQELLSFAVRIYDESIASIPCGENEYPIISGFADRMRKAGLLTEFALDVLPKAADAFCSAARVKTAAEQNGSVDAQVDRELAALSYNTAKSAEWMPLVMRVLMRRDPPSKTARTLRRVERLAAYLTICVSNAKARAARYVAAGLAVSADDALLPLQLSAEEVQALRAAIDDPLLYKKRYAKLVLLRADLALRDGGSPPNKELVDRATVEHVLPQQPEDKSRWLRDFPSAAEREERTHSLGNLMLIPRAKNSKAGRLDFREKLDCYFKRDGDPSFCSFVLTDTVYALEQWTPKEMDKRHQLLRNALCSNRGWEL